MACVGCSSVPLPAFITGFGETSDANRLEPSSGWRSTRTSEYMDIIRTVSARLSPLCMDDDRTSDIPSDPPPMDAIAASKLSRVRVLGS